MIRAIGITVLFIGVGLVALAVGLSVWIWWPSNVR